MARTTPEAEGDKTDNACKAPDEKNRQIARWPGLWSTRLGENSSPWIQLRALLLCRGLEIRMKMRDKFNLLGRYFKRIRYGFAFNMRGPSWVILKCRSSRTEVNKETARFNVKAWAGEGGGNVRNLVSRKTLRMTGGEWKNEFLWVFWNNLVREFRNKDFFCISLFYKRKSWIFFAM